LAPPVSSGAQERRSARKTSSRGVLSGFAAGDVADLVFLLVPRFLQKEEPMGINELFLYDVYHRIVSLKGLKGSLLRKKGRRGRAAVDVSVFMHQALASIPVTENSAANLARRILQRLEVYVDDSAPGADDGMELMLVFDAPSSTIHHKNASFLRRSGQQADEREAQERRRSFNPSGDSRLATLDKKLRSVPDGWEAEVVRLALSDSQLRRHVSFIQAPMQADSQLAELVDTDCADVVLSVDSDVVVLGHKAVLLRAHVSGSPDQVVLASLNDMADLKELPPEIVFERSVREKLAKKYPLKPHELAVFKTADTAWERAQKAALLGCDPWPTGANRLTHNSLTTALKTKKLEGVVVDHKVQHLVLYAASAFMLEHVTQLQPSPQADALDRDPGRLHFRSCVTAADRNRAIPTALASLRLRAGPRLLSANTEKGTDLETFRCVVGDHISIAAFRDRRCSTHQDVCRFCTDGPRKWQKRDSSAAASQAGQSFCIACWREAPLSAEGPQPYRIAPLQSGSVGDTNLGALFKLARSDADEIHLEIRAVDSAPITHLSTFLKQQGIPGVSKMSKEEVREMARLVLNGTVPGHEHLVRDRLEQFFARVREAVDKQEFERREVQWAFGNEFDEPSSGPSALFTSDFCRTCTHGQLRVLLRLACQFLRPIEVGARNPAEARAFLFETATAMRLGGGTEHLIKYARRGAVHQPQEPIISASVTWMPGKSEGDPPILFIRHLIYPTMKHTPYMICVWLSVDGLEFSRCKCCVGGGIFCVHTMVLLQQLEDLVCQESNGLCDVLLDAYRRLSFVDRETVRADQDLLLPVARHVHGPTLGLAELFYKVLPGTELPPLARLFPRQQTSSDYLNADDLVPRSPGAVGAALRVMASKFVPEMFECDKPEVFDLDQREQPEDVNVFPPEFPVEVVDYVSIYKFGRLYSEVHDKVPFFLVALRAAEEVDRLRAEVFAAQARVQLCQDRVKLERRAAVDRRQRGVRRPPKGKRGDTDRKTPREQELADAEEALSVAEHDLKAALDVGESDDVPDLAERARVVAGQQAAVVLRQQLGLSDSGSAGRPQPKPGPKRRRGGAVSSHNRSCQFKACKCTERSCPTLGPFRRAPEKSTASSEAKRRQARQKLRKWLDCCEPSVRPRICRCHELIDGAPSPVGVAVARPSTRETGATAERRAQPYVHEQLDDTAGLVLDLTQETARLSAELDAALAKLARVEAAIPEAAAKLASPPLTYASVAAREKQDLFHVYTGFKTVADFEFFLAVLCNARFDVLDNLLILRNDGVASLRPQNSSRRRLSGRDMFLLYFMRENGSSVKKLAAEFQIPIGSADRYIATCAQAVKLRKHAWGVWPTYDEGVLLTPEEWKGKVRVFVRCVQVSCLLLECRCDLFFVVPRAADSFDRYDQHRSRWHPIRCLAPASDL
jgi:XPG I-region